MVNLQITSFQDYLEEHSLVRTGDRVVLGVSGGLDSTVLLHLFLRIAADRDLSLSVGHVHHGLRGASADRDEAFVRDLCRGQGLPFYAMKYDAAARARERRCSVEEAARVLRLGFLESLLDRLDHDALALGHHADDRAETILMHLVRGAGVRGLSGIQPRRGRIVHPLLFATREQLASYAEERGIAYVTDPTNRSSRYLRNRVRKSVIPAMRRAFETDVIHGIVRSGNYAGEARRMLDSLTESALSRCVEIENPHEMRLDIDRFLGYFNIVQKRMIARILEERLSLGRLLRSSELDRILDLLRRESVRRVLIDEETRVVRTRDALVFCRGVEGFKARRLEEGGSIRIQGMGIRITARRVTEREAVFGNHPGSEIADLDRVRFPLTVKPYDPGDWFVPLGMTGRKKLQDFFVDERVPVTDRGRIPIVVSGRDVVWVAGYRLDHRFRVTENTERFLKLEVEYQGKKIHRHKENNAHG